jgi:hypothetical protein
MRRARGNTMALYAAFILFVGVPLMAFTVDVSRLRAAQVKLMAATEAGCAAYANSVNADVWITGGQYQFASNAQVSAVSVFYLTAPPNSWLNIAPDIGNGLPMQAHCIGGTTVYPFIDMGIGEYHATAYADSKSAWASNPFTK